MKRDIPLPKSVPKSISQAASDDSWNPKATYHKILVAAPHND